MKTKTFGAKRLLSLVLTLAMLATIILPTNVFADENGTITTDLDEKTIVVGEAVEFTVSSTKNEVGGEIWVKGKFEVEADPSDLTLEYKESTDGNWYLFPTTSSGGILSGEFGPVGTGFPLMDATSIFRVTFEKAGTYSVKVSAIKVEDDSEVCFETVNITVYDGYADYTALESAVSTAKTYSADKYTTASYKVLTDAITAAENAIGEKWTSDKQDDVTDLVEDINNAVAGLEALADYSELAVAYEAGKNITNVNGTYTAKTFKALTDALDAADEPANAELTDQDEVDALTDAIYDAIAGLVKNVKVTFTAVAVADEASVDYAKANKIVLVFVEPVDDMGNEVVSKLNIADEVSYAEWTTSTVYTLTLKENHKLTNDAEITFDGDETIFTISGNAMADAETIVIGNLTEAYQQITATKMAATIVNCDDKPGVDAGDKIVLVFNAPVKDNPDSITVNGMTAVAVPDTYNTVYEITLTGTENINDDTKLTYGTIADVALNGTFGTAIAPKVLSAVAVDKDGTAKTEGDEIVIIFDRPTNGSIDISALDDFTDAKWNTENTELTLTVGAGATIKNGDTIDISSMGVMDENELVDATNTSVELKGSFGTVTAPKINGAYAVDNDGEATVVGDMVVITFDRPTNGAAIDLKKDGIIANQATTFGSKSTFAWTEDNTKLVITLGINANIESGVEIDLSNQGIMDADSIVDADIHPVLVEGSFGSSLEPKITRAIAFTQNNEHIIRVFFNTEVVVKEYGTLDVYVENFDTPKGTWTTNGISYYDIVLEEGHDELESGAIIKFEGTLVDKKTGKMELKDAETTISGGFEQDIDMQILSLTAYSNDGSGVAKAGDRLVLVLNSEATIVTSELGTFETEDNITWVYTLKNDNEVKIADKVTFSSIKSKTNGKTYTNMSASIAGSFGYVAEPKLLSATAYSKDGSGVAKAGDEIIAVFDSQVSSVTSSLGSVSTDDGIVWKITLGDNPTITVGTTLNFAVKSVATGKEYNNLSVALGGSFGKVIEPQILSATAYSNDGSGIAKSENKIVVVFNTPVLYVNSPLGSVSTDDNIVWTITLGENPTITVGTELSFDVTAVATNKDYKELKVKLDGSFGKVIEPEILSVTAVSNNGRGVPEVGDKIIVVFNTLVEIDGLETYVYTYELKANDTLADFEIGKNYAVSVRNVSTGKSYKLVKEIEGSYGLKVEPTVKSVVLSEANGAEAITVVFDRATNKASIDTSILYKNNGHLGQGVAAAWLDEYILKISLAANASTTDTDKLDLSGLGIKAANTEANVENIDELTISGTLVPVVKNVSASGKDIVITFSTRTNGVANISNLTALLGMGATASWSDNNKILTITLGENYTITNNGYIILNGMGIYDAFSETYHVVGQYKVLGSIDTDKLVVSKIVAQSTDKSKATAQKGDTIVVKFNSATNLNGAVLNQILNSAEVDEIITISGGNEIALGTGYTGEWTAYDTLVITLGGAEVVTEGEEETTIGSNPEISVGTEITVSGVAFANGEGEMDSAVTALTGSFNGREFVLTNGGITRTGASNTGDYRIAVTVENTLLNPSVVPTVVCVAYNGKSPVSVMRITVDVENTIQPVFEFAEGLKITSAKIYVFNEVFGDINSSPDVLAETLEVK